jgi:hypothetical protein
MRKVKLGIVASLAGLVAAFILLLAPFWISERLWDRKCVTIHSPPTRQTRGMELAEKRALLAALSGFDWVKHVSKVRVEDNTAYLSLENLEIFDGVNEPTVNQLPSRISGIWADVFARSHPGRECAVTVLLAGDGRQLRRDTCCRASL